MYNYQSLQKTFGTNLHTAARLALGLLAAALAAFAAGAAVVVQDPGPPTVAFHTISIQLDASGNYSLTAADIDAISACSTDNCASITNRTVTPSTFSFCDQGTKSVTLTVTDSSGNSVSQTGDLAVLAPTGRPTVVYVDAAYPSSCAPVSFPNIPGTFYAGYNAFPTIQAGVDALADGGTVNVAAGTYTENVSVGKPLSLLGPNAGRAGAGPGRAPEALVITAKADPENGTIISVLTSNVVVDGFTLDGFNPDLPAESGYQGNGALLFTSAGVQNADVYPNLSNVCNVTIQNNIIRNVTYDGIYLDRIDFFTTASTGNFILNNKFEDMWEGIQTYALHTVIANNTFSNLNRGLSIHGTITDAGDFTPAITNNTMTIAQWWPVELSPARLRTVGIWVNYRRENAPPLWVADNVIETPTAAPAGKTIRGLEALTVDGNGAVTFARNTVNGDGNCHQGMYVNSCWSNNAVQLLGGSLNNVHTGILADTLDPDWGNGDAYITVSNVTINTAGGGTGVLALHDPTTANHARVNLIANSVVTGGFIGVGVQGANAAASILNNAASITGNFYGIDVDDGKALVENNDLTGNLAAAIRTAGAGVVDAGDCSGANVTGLGTGSGRNGSSAGLNNLYSAGYPARAFPLAIQNIGSVTVLGQNDNYGATAGDNIATVVNGLAEYSQGNSAYIVCPAPISVQCVGEIPPGATSLADFIALGGNVSANPATITYSNYPASPLPGDQTVYRTYFVTDACGLMASCTQTITVKDQTSPTITSCPANIVTAVDPGQTYATVNFAASASDNCDPFPNIAYSIPAGQFPVGTNTVTVTATDASLNSSACSFTVAVVGLPAITAEPLSRTNVAGSTATFTVAASSPAPVSYQWIKIGSGPISGATTDTLTLHTVSDADSADYAVEVSNFAGTTTSSSAHLTVWDPPLITTQPRGQTNNAGTTVSFTVSVAANTTAPISYQWRKNGAAIAGTTTTILTLPNVLAADDGQYAVVVANAAGTATSDDATLLVIDPAILAQPGNVITPVGTPASFSVSAAGTPALAYQWFFGNAAIPGATSSSYSIAGTVDSDAGSYTVTVTNVIGSVTSAPALLALTHPPVITQQPRNVTTNQGSTATFTVSVNGATPFSYQWYKGGAPVTGGTSKKLVLVGVTPADNGSYNVAVTNADGYALSASATLTVIVPPVITTQPVGATNDAGSSVSFSVTATGTSPSYQWIRNGTNLLTDVGNVQGSHTPILTVTNLLGADDGEYTVAVGNPAGSVTSSQATLLVIDPIITNPPADLIANFGTPASFSVGAYGTAPHYQWRKDGTDISGATASTYTIASVGDSDAGAYTVVVSNAFGVVTSAPPANLTVNDSPTIIAQPSSLSVNQGHSASFTVGVDGATPFSYQWHKGATPIAGATDSTYSIASAQPDDEADYTVVVTNVAGSATSTAAHLSVIIPPAITTQPQSLTRNAGQSATFSVVATGTSPSYQWKKGGADIHGATASSLTLGSVSDSDVADYTVVVSNPAGTATSDPAHLTVIDPPVITTPPASLTRNAGQTATFTVAYTGTNPSFQWYKHGAPLADAGKISGSATATLTITDVSDSDADSYTVTLSNAADTVTSTPATLTVIDPPVITQQPASRTNNASTTAAFTVAASDTSPGVQWYKFGTNVLADAGKISGSTSDTLTIADVLAADAGDYTAVLQNAAGSVTSIVATLTVIDPAILVQPVGQTNIVGTTANFTVTAAGTPTLTYQWKQNGFDLFGETDSSLTINNIADSDAGYYTVEVTGPAGTVTSDPAYLQTFPPLIVTEPASVTTDIGQSASFSVSVNGQTPFSYVWQKNGNPVPGATARIFTIPAVQAGDAANYRVVVTNPNGSETSHPAVLTLITTQPQSLTQISNSTATFTVAVTGLPSTYQWKKNGSPIADATTTILSLPNIGAPDAATYSVVINNSAGSATSANATLTIVAQPTLRLLSYTPVTRQPTLSVSGSSGFKYAIRSTTNFTDWVILVTNAAPYTYIDTGATDLEQRFYQGFWVP